eukprot:CAMPEP_0197434692 /NCGR_PEP_ID=MMETSP1175-20131217/2390_1 /TAXON_ID=1003142 /ORGANISM="Triceratium dubium, Strain CCMP147" /LENGTH=141 /DNA_ID=CAMNT_0042963509 /DNA_START=166 /DNA_END=586 /DNA_ORIENTATION=+
MSLSLTRVLLRSWQHQQLSFESQLLSSVLQRALELLTPLAGTTTSPSFSLSASSLLLRTASALSFDSGGYALELGATTADVVDPSLPKGVGALSDMGGYAPAPADDAPPFAVPFSPDDSADSMAGPSALVAAAARAARPDP